MDAVIKMTILSDRVVITYRIKHDNRWITNAIFN